MVKKFSHRKKQHVLPNTFFRFAIANEQFDCSLGISKCQFISICSMFLWRFTVRLFSCQLWVDEHRSAFLDEIRHSLAAQNISLGIGSKLGKGLESQMLILWLIQSHLTEKVMREVRCNLSTLPCCHVLKNIIKSSTKFFGGNSLLKNIYPRHSVSSKICISTDLDDSNAPALYLHRKFSWYCFG